MDPHIAGSAIWPPSPGHFSLLGSNWKAGRGTSHPFYVGSWSRSGPWQLPLYSWVVRGSSTTQLQFYSFYCPVKKPRRSGPLDAIGKNVFIGSFSLGSNEQPFQCPCKLRSLPLSPRVGPVLVMRELLLYSGSRNASSTAVTSAGTTDFLWVSIDRYKRVNQACPCSTIIGHYVTQRKQIQRWRHLLWPISYDEEAHDTARMRYL